MPENDTPALQVELEEDPPRGRFKLLNDAGQMLGEMTFSRARDDLIIIDHTEVDDSLRGKHGGLRPRNQDQHHVDLPVRQRHVRTPRIEPRRLGLRHPLDPNELRNQLHMRRLRQGIERLQPLQPIASRKRRNVRR